MCNINNKIKVFFIISAKLRIISKAIISKAMQSFRAYPALNSLGVSHSQVAWQIVRPYRHCTDEETNIVPLWSSYLFAFCPFYIIIVYTQGACLDQSVLVTSPYACHRVYSTGAQSASRGSQQQWLQVNSVSISMSINCKPRRKGWASWQQSRVKGLSSGGRQCVTAFPGLSMWFGSLKQLAEQSQFGCE